MVWRVVALLVLVGCKLHFAEQPPDAAIADVSPDSSDALDLCAQSSTILCDDFTTMSGASSTVGDVQWDPAGGRSGGGILVHAVPAGGSVATYALPSAVMSGPLNVRSYLRVRGGPAVQGYAVVTELSNGASTGGQQKISADILTGDLWGMGAPFSGGGPGSTVSVVRDTWTCVEVQIVVSSTAGEMRLRVDGVEIAAKTGANTLIPGGFSVLLLAASLSAGEPDTYVYFDDLVVATAPIGC